MATQCCHNFAAPRPQCHTAGVNVRHLLSVSVRATKKSFFPAYDQIKQINEHSIHYNMKD